MSKLAPTELDSECHSAEFDITTIRAIAAIQHGNATTAALDEEIKLCLQTLGSDSTTAEEQALCQITRNKLRSLSNWSA